MRKALNQCRNFKDGVLMCQPCTDDPLIERCHCRLFNSEEHLKKVRGDLDKYFETNDKVVFEEIKSKSKMDYKSDIANKENRPNHIDYQPNTEDEMDHYNSFFDQGNEAPLQGPREMRKVWRIHEQGMLD